MIDNLHGGNIKQYLKNTPQGIGKIIDFSANINPLGLSYDAKKSIIKNIREVTCYPEPDSRSLKTALADFHNIKQDTLAVGNGSIELIYLIPRALGVRKALIITPTFSEYEFASRSNDVRIMYFKTEAKDDFRLRLNKLKKYLSWADLVFLGNPNNPTGLCLPAGDMQSLIKLCIRHKTILAIDEAFMDFVEGFDKDSLIPLATKKQGLLIIRSLTKFFALPGLRIGYVIGHRGFISKICAFQYPWNVNSLAQVAAEAVLKDRHYMDKTRKYVSAERRYLFSTLKEIKGLKAFPSSSNFILCKLDKCALKSARALNEQLIKRGIVVRNCSNFKGLDEKFFRLAVRRRKENLKLITALRETL